MSSKVVRMTQKEAIDFILSNGWKFWNPIENVPLFEQYFWDGKDKTVGYAWGAAVKEIKRREQLSLFGGSK